jgi:outer membrane protein
MNFLNKEILRIMKKNFLAPLFVLTVGLAGSAWAEEARVGIVDMQKALQSVEAGKKAKSQLETEFNKKKQEIQKEETSLKKASEEFQKQSLVMSEQARGKKQAELQERFLKHQELIQKSQAEIQKKEQELTEPIIGKLRALISEIAKKKKYSVVLEKNENNVLFSEEKDDLTNEVVTTYNKNKT